MNYGFQVEKRALKQLIDYNEVKFAHLRHLGGCILEADFDDFGGVFASALEAWVERGVAPNALLARKLDPASNNVVMGKIDWSARPLRTMPLCAFPQMAHYTGQGNVNDARNWACGAGDTRMLTVGETGRRAGVVP